MGLINYLGNSKVIKKICQLLNVTDVQDSEGHSLVDENGIAIVSGGGGSSTLADLTDVDVTGASDGDVLALNDTSGKWEDKTLATVATSGSFNDLSNQPTKLSDFYNDSGFITNTVNNLTNYYKKSETYTQSEVDALISAVVTIDIEVVQSLPTTDISTTTIYLLPKQTAGTDDVYDEYINTTGTSAGWELIGSTQVDLSNYYTKSEVDALIPDISTKVSKSGDTMSGTLSMGTTDNVAIDFRPNHASYHTTISHQTGGNEACVFATKSAVTSFIFANGEDSIANHSSNRWQSLTPALQIKNGKVAIGKLIANGTTPTDSLDVAGNTKLETLNSLPPNTYMGVIESGNSIINVLKNTAPFGASLWLTQQADDSPTKGSVSCSLICKHTSTGAYSYVYHFNSNGVIRIAGTGNPAPSALTWTQIDARNANYANSAGSATDSSKEPKVSWTSKNNWNYYKDSGNRYHLHYNSGNVSINFNGSIGNLKYRNTTYDINFPVTLSSAHSIQVSALCNNDIVGATIHSYTASGIKLWLWAAGSGTKTIQIHIDVVST